MQILDTGNIVFAAIFVDLAKEKARTVELGYLRHLILNSIRANNIKFKSKYGELVLAVDSPSNWRREKYPWYKANRTISRNASMFDWKDIFKKLDTIYGELEKYMPYKFIRQEGCEADDIIGTFASHFEELRSDPQEKLLIISQDKDFGQLQKYKWVHQYKPCQKVDFKELNPKISLMELICRGDSSDGIPNIKSPTDSFILKKRQSPVTTKFIKSIIDTNGECMTEEVKQRFLENEELISLDKTPQDLQDLILAKYKEQTPNKDFSKILAYFASKNLNVLAGQLNDFIPFKRSENNG